MKNNNVPFLRRVLVKAAAAGSALFIENHLLSVSRYRVCSPKLPKAFEGVRILQLSDLHSTSFGRENARLLRRAESENPDYIVMTGDMVSRTDRNHTAFFCVAKALGRRFPCYYVVGNHEQDMTGSQRDTFFARLASYGVHVMNNETLELQKNGESIRLSGMWYPLSYYRESKHEARHDSFTLRDMNRSMGKPTGVGYHILLTHNPLSFAVYAAWGADLTFCGHVHGGMVRLPFLGGLLSPERRFFPKYSAGIYESDGKKMVVSRGLGSGLFGARIMNLPEMIVVTLCSEAQQSAKD